jgi:uncharacterized protein
MIGKNIFYLGMIMIIVISMGIVMIKPGSSSSSEITGNVVAGGKVQNVKVKVVNGEYILEPSELKKDVLVRMEGDVNNMPGCSRAVVIPTFRASKTFYEGDNFLEFMPDKAGTFNIACSMNMYRGTFTVLESDGTESDFVEQKLSGSNSCGSSGGCGCGS